MKNLLSKTFDTKQTPPDQAAVDALEAEIKQILATFNRRMRWATVGEVFAMLCAYAGGLALSGSVGSIGLGLLIVGIGPSVAIIAFTLLAKARRTELKNALASLQPIRNRNAHSELRGRAPEVDYYLDQLAAQGRPLTATEEKMLIKFGFRRYPEAEAATAAA